MGDIHLWTTTHGHIRDGKPAKTYIHQLCSDGGGRVNDLPGVMTNKDG